MTPAIRAVELRKHYGELAAVDGVDFEVKAGATFGLLGPNGAGKTTTIRILVGLSEPTSGSAVVNGFDVVADKTRMKATIGVVPELSNLYPELSCLGNLRYMAELYGVPGAECRGRCEGLLEQFGLTDRASDRFETLSRGLKRRLTIAAALVHRPSVLFLDEPTTGLDVVSARNLRTLVRQLNVQGTTIFLTTHLIPEAETLCDRIALIVKGRIIAIDTPAGLKARLQQATTLELRTRGDARALAEALEASAAIRHVSASDGALRMEVSEVNGALAAIVDCAARAGVEITHVTGREPTLEDAFVELTGVQAELMRIDKPQKQGGA